MAGKWWFNIKETASTELFNENNFDLVKYQNMLVQWKARVQNTLKQDNNSIIEWTKPSDLVNKVSNVFVVFKYKCIYHQENGYAQWKLFWNPLIVPTNQRESTLNDSCIPGPKHKTIYVRFQCDLWERFPEIFDFVYDDSKYIDSYPSWFIPYCVRTNA